MIATPRTDELAAKLYDNDIGGAAAALGLLDMCRKLERDLVAANISLSEAVQECDRLKSLVRVKDRAYEALNAKLADYERLEAICENRSDVLDGDEGRQLPNEAMSILMEWRSPV